MLPRPAARAGAARQVRRVPLPGPASRSGRRSPVAAHGTFRVEPSVLAERAAGAPGGLAVAGNRPTSPRAWAEMYSTVKGAVKELSPAGLVKAVKAGPGLLGRGAVVVDVRPYPEYSVGHVAGSRNVQFYRPIEGNAPSQLLRKAAFAFFGIANGTELNPAFFDELEGAVKPGQEIILLCQTGGTLAGTRNFPQGRQSRSLIVAYELIQAGYRKVSFVTGGYIDVFKEPAAQGLLTASEGAKSINPLERAFTSGFIGDPESRR